MSEKIVAWLDIADKLLLLLGVLFGFLLPTLIAPWIESRRDRIRDQKRVRSALIQQLYLFFNVQKQHMKALNYLEINARLETFCREDHLTAKFEVDKKRTEEQYSKVREARANNWDEHVLLFDRMINIEASILGLLSEAKNIYPEDSYSQFDSIVKPQLHEANHGRIRFYNYEKLTRHEIAKIQDTVGEKIYNKTLDLQKVCDGVIERIFDI